MHQRYATEQECTAVQPGQGLNQGLLHLGVQQGAVRSPGNLVEQFTLGLQQVAHVARAALGPGYLVVAGVGQLGGDQNPAATHHVAAAQHVRGIQAVLNFGHGAFAPAKCGGGQAGDHAQVRRAGQLCNDAFGNQFANGEMLGLIAARFKRDDCHGWAQLHGDFTE